MMQGLKHYSKELWFKWCAKSYPYTPELSFPLERWKVNDVGFLQNQNYSGVDWGKHLGEDCLAEPGTPVFTIGRGRVVYSALHASSTPPEDEGKKGSNWGNIIIIAHKNPRTGKVFFSVYGHLGERLVETGEDVERGQKIGTVGRGWTPENGWWKNSHLHFAIYVGPWTGVVLPGAYGKKSKKRTKLEYWESPTSYVQNYNPRGG